MKTRDIVDFIYEVGQLKRIPHIGWIHAGIRDPERVGEHAFRASQIAYILAELEGADPNKTSLMTLIHDNGEARIGDHDLLTQYYVDAEAAEHQAFEDQLSKLPETIAKRWLELFREREAKETIEAKCSKDADMLEQAFQAKEYLDQGYPYTQKWIDNVAKALHTESARKILEEMEKRGFMDWVQVDRLAIKK